MKIHLELGFKPVGCNLGFTVESQGDLLLFLFFSPGDLLRKKKCPGSILGEKNQLDIVVSLKLSPGDSNAAKLEKIVARFVTLSHSVVLRPFSSPHGMNLFGKYTYIKGKRSFRKWRKGIKGEAHSPPFPLAMEGEAVGLITGGVCSFLSPDEL